MNTFSRLIAASLTVMAVSPAFAGEKVVKVTPVAQTESGRTVVKADGSLFIELQPSEYNVMTAQQVYEKARAKIRAGLQEGEVNPAEDVRSQRAGIYMNTNTEPPIHGGFNGISLTSGEIVGGQSFIPTRDQRLQRPGTRTYVMVESEKDADVMVQPNCRNPDGHADVLGRNRGNTGCYVVLKVFKKINLK